jgi:hypothetical protein
MKTSSEDLLEMGAQFVENHGESEVKNLEEGQDSEEGRIGISSISADRNKAPCYNRSDALWEGRTKNTPASGGPMERFLGEGPLEQSSILVRLDNGKLTG